MKKFFLYVFTALTIGITISCTKENNGVPVAKAQKTVIADKTDVGQGD